MDRSLVGRYVMRAVTILVELEGGRFRRGTSQVTRSDDTQDELRMIERNHMDRT